MQKFSSNQSPLRRWIPIALIIILVAAIGFAAFAFYITHKAPDQARSANGFTGLNPPPPPKYNCPLDGTFVPNRAAASLRPIVVQVDNAPAARDQIGLSQADIVYEELAEGDVTRFSAIFACHEASVIGPVRSARLIDLELVPEYQALLANSGASDGTTAELEAAQDIPNINDNGYHDLAYWRVDDRAAPHNLMTSTTGIRNGAAQFGFTVTAQLQSLFFKDDTPAPAISTITIPYSSWANVNYKYDAALNAWLRFEGSEVSKDAGTGKQLAPKNVIIQFVPSQQSNIVEDVGGALGMQFQLTGSGRVLVFRDGQVIDGVWSRPNRNDVTQYYDAAKQPIPLNRGLTFVQIVDTSFQPGWG